MKHLLFISASLLALIFATGCGSNFVENETLGTIPSIYIEFETKTEAQKQQMVTDITSASDMNKTMVLKAKYDKKAKELKEEKERMATAELERIRGRELPYSFSYEENRFKIRSATIEEIAASSGAVSVKLLIEAKSDMVGTYYDDLYFMVIGSDNRIIYKHYVNPFTKINPMSPSSFGSDKMVIGNALCCEEGSMLMLYCGSYDMTTFKQIVFITKDDFKKQRN